MNLEERKLGLDRPLTSLTISPNVILSESGQRADQQRRMALIGEDAMDSAQRDLRPIVDLRQMC